VIPGPELLTRHNHVSARRCSCSQRLCIIATYVTLHRCSFTSANYGNLLLDQRSINRARRNVDSRESAVPKLGYLTQVDLPLPALVQLATLLVPQELTITNDSHLHASHAAMRAQGGGSGETREFTRMLS
jgi:hypothetical protein